MDETLNELKDDLAENPLNMDFQGLDHFSNEVLFAKIIDDDVVKRLNEIANVIQKTFREIGIEVTDERFKPHLTILKLSKLKFKDKKECQSLVKKIKPDLYEDAKDTNFGSDRVTSLQLLSMNDKKEADGYYRCIKEVFF